MQSIVSREIPLSLYVSYLKVSNRTPRYSELFVELNKSLHDVKNAETGK